MSRFHMNEGNQNKASIFYDTRFICIVLLLFLATVQQVKSKVLMFISWGHILHSCLKRRNWEVLGIRNKVSPMYRNDVHFR